MSSTWNSMPARFGNLAAESDEALRFLQRRLALLAAATAAIAGTFVVFVLVVTTLGSGVPADAYRDLARSAHAIGTCLMVSVWLLTRRRRLLSARTLAVLDAVLVIAACLSWTVMGLGLGGVVGLFTAILACFATCLARAVLVPTTVGRTLWTTAIALVPLPVLAAVMTYDLTPRGGPVDSLLTVQAGIWALSALGLALVTTRVVYGLQAQVRKAQQLGQYTLESKIGRGGMGEVYRARHALLRRPTAVKLLSATGARQLRRFEQEVQLTSQLTHPNTIVVSDYGHTPDGVFYYAMEYLDGQNLGELVRRCGPLPPARVIHLLLQVCAALGEAHGVGLIHRDIKPENIVVGVRGGVADFVKVLDFGLVKELEPGGDAERTTDNVIAGTPHYMAPEAIVGADVDARADLYALGCVGYYLLTGEPVFAGDSIVAVCSAHLHQPPRPISEVRPDAPPDLAAVLLACLEKQREQRPASADELAALLSGCDHANGWTRAQATAAWKDLPLSPAGPPTELEHAETLMATVQVDLADRVTH